MNLILEWPGWLAPDLASVAAPLRELSGDHRLFLLSTSPPERVQQVSKQLPWIAAVRTVAGDPADALRALIETEALHPFDTLLLANDPRLLASGAAQRVQTATSSRKSDTSSHESHGEASAAPDHVLSDLAALRDHLERRASIDRADRPIATVGALLFDADDRILLVRTDKWSGLYAIPGGKIDYGETQEEALRREVLEETGLELGDVRFACVQDCIESPEFYKPRHFLLIDFVARVVGGSLRLNYEADGSRWVTLEESLTLPLNGPTRTLILDVVERDLRPARTAGP